MPELLLRILLTIGIALLGLLIYRLANAAVLARAARAGAAAQAQGDALFEPGRPAVLYFTTPSCATCKSFQRPQLRRLEGLLGTGVQVVEVDASQRPDLAGRWGVLSVPTTFVVDPSGKPRHVNHGAVPAEKLAEQLRALAAG